MIWWFTSTRHDLAIKPWVRQWLGGTMLDRWLQITIPGSVWAGFWFFFIAIVAAGNKHGILSGFLFFLFLIATLPWWFWIVDAIVDHFHVQADLLRYTTSDDVVMATRCEYQGGHPELPHGRFAYLLLEGTREDPNVTIGFPAAEKATIDHFTMPLLDLVSMKESSRQHDSPVGEAVSNIIGEMSSKTSLKEAAGKLLRPERVTLAVQYQGAASRKHEVELTNFFNGNGETRNWRNYLICAQAEADTGVVPFGPWKSLKPGLPAVQEVASDGSGNGRERPVRRSAFARR
jgi:hypothetical protein